MIGRQLYLFETFGAVDVVNLAMDKYFIDCMGQYSHIVNINV